MATVIIVPLIGMALGLVFMLAAFVKWKQGDK